MATPQRTNTSFHHTITQTIRTSVNFYFIITT